MTDSRLIGLLSSFSTKELKQLKLMVDSPFFNNQEPIKKLMDFLLGFAPQFDSPKMTYQNAYGFIYGKKSIQSDPQTAVLKVMSKLTGLIKDFVVQLELEEHPVHWRLLQAKYFEKKQLLEYVPRFLDEAEALVKEIPYQNEYYFRYKLLLEFERSSFLNIIQDKSSLDYNLGVQNEALDHYYAMSKLQTYCFAKNEANRTTFNYDFSQMAAFLDWIKATDLTSVPSIKLWYQALVLLNEPSTEHFYHLKNDIIQHRQYLDPPVMRAMYSYLANTAPIIHLEREIFLKEVFDLYRTQIDLGILYINGFLSPVLLRNITIFGLKLREFDWVEQFLQENADKIVPTYAEREDIVALCKAYLYFGRGDFLKTLDMINTLHCDNIFTKMDERRLRLMCYYEMNIGDPFDDLVNSFRKFLTDHKKKTPESHITVNRLFIHYIHKIAASNYLKKDQLLAIAEEVQQVPVLPEKEWLLAKITERIR